MPTPLLKLENVSYRRGDARVLHSLSWSVHEGEHWAVLGPNGCGKTTMMLIATGYEPSSGGRVFLVNGYISDIVLPRVREKVAFVSAALHDHMLEHRADTTGLEVVLSGRYASLGMFRKPSPEEIGRAEDILSRLGIEALRDKPFRLMSTGQRQACLVARTRMADAELVLLDEPCAGLDLAAREQLLRSLGEACSAEDCPPHVLVTHHPQEIVREVSHVLLMRDGRVVAQGPRERMMTRPLLERTFGVPLRIVRQDGRVWIMPRGE